MIKKTSNEPRRRGIYLLPNLFTTAALFAGFYAIVAAMHGRFEPAAIAIFVAMILDGIDGRVARLTNTQTDFGAEYDSLSDMVSFGLAPALVIYQWSLFSLGKLGWLAAFIYAATAALRLARFNTQVEHADKRYFQGLASPSAAAIIAGAVWVGETYEVFPEDLSYLMWGITVVVGLLMVSNVRYYSFKTINLRHRVPFVAVLVIVLILVLISSNPPVVLFAGFLVYALSGPVLTLIQLRRRRAERMQAHQQDEPENTEDLEKS
ncbi:MAG: CDP-diacylglycerol--serine O-phosphatidyltransferase [Thiohalophilus sp.]|jgi:CDP-diacylglycerol--serine O-phosphatidyltransferase